MSRARKGPVIDAPRLPTGRAVPVLRDLEIGDDGVYTDLDVVQGRLANTVARNVRIERACLRDTDLSQARLERLTLADVRLERCDLANGFWRDARSTGPSSSAVGSPASTWPTPR